MVLVEQKLAIQTKSKSVDDKTYFKFFSNIFDRAEIIKSNSVDKKSLLQIKNTYICNDKNFQPDTLHFNTFIVWFNHIRCSQSKTRLDTARVVLGRFWF